MLAKMGWKGAGLGKQEQGRPEPIRIKVQQAKAIARVYADVRVGVGWGEGVSLLHCVQGATGKSNRASATQHFCARARVCVRVCVRVLGEGQEGEGVSLFHCLGETERGSLCRFMTCPRSAVLFGVCIALFVCFAGTNFQSWSRIEKVAAMRVKPCECCALRVDMRVCMGFITATTRCQCFQREKQAGTGGAGQAKKA